ncbi:MAG TPA: hypothetical protein VL049_09175 [Candidatus Dormibacteraeota bacterium]|nr:hypothetical protein [Candidatus Dormibacteraeota bacterium]
MKRALPLLLLLATAAAAGAQTRAPAPKAPPPGNVDSAPVSPLDGEWRGTSDGGSCNAPLDYVLTIENGFVDGSAFDTTAHGPVPNLRKAPAPAPTPGLWQIHGVAKATGTFSLLSVASVKAADRREGKLTARSEGGGLVITENGGCRRTARLSRSS